MSATCDGPAAPSRAIQDGLEALGVRRLALAIHDASLPGGGDLDLGRGAPGSPAASRFVAFARRLGFDALQLGPQGLTAEDDASPYMGASFSRTPLSISLEALADAEGEWGELVPAARLAALAARRPPGSDRRVPYAWVFRTQRRALGLAFERFEKGRAAGEPAARDLDERLDRFSREAAPWLDADALYEALRGEYGGRDWSRWEGPRAEVDRRLGDAARREGVVTSRRAELARRHGPMLRFYRFVQMLAHAQHARFRRRTHDLGMALLGDLPVGLSPRDTWRAPEIFLAAYRLGAPPSRTNPDGQPWDVPVLDPDAYEVDGQAGPAPRFVDARVEKMFAEYDGLRIDHPQGLVCPWVYRAHTPDPLRAVQQGARLFSSPDLPDHPELARHAIARRGDLTRDPATPRHDDHWVARLDAGQVDRYARIFDRVVDLARKRGRTEPALICEVLSTLPHPLARVLARHDLGRLRVTQKADLSDPDDVYRAENAEPHDWILFGSHDTPTLWGVVDAWREAGTLAARAAHAAARLEPATGARDAFRERLVAEPGLLAHAEIAQLFASPARHVSVFFADLFGLVERYNRPGTVGDDNWSLRLPATWEDEYATRLGTDRALNLPLALWLALRGRRDAAPADLVRALREEAERPRRGAPLRGSDDG